MKNPSTAFGGPAPREPVGTVGEGALHLCGAAAMLLGWRPGEFWEATPAELAAALRPAGPAEAPDADAIAELIRRFPDEKEQHG